MKYKILFFCLFLELLNTQSFLFAQQDAPNDMNAVTSSGYTTAFGKFAGTPINLYTGIPNIGIPIFHYSHHNGLSLNVSLDYFAGGVKVNELPSPEGLNWILNAGGAIARTVRGMPDDFYPKGSMYSAALPSDPTSSAYNYYHDSSDAELDVFQYNFNGRSGKFYIGKNKQIRMVPLSKARVSFDTAAGGIIIFRITTEDGMKYVFSDRETMSVSNVDFKSGYNNKVYTSAWYLSQMIAPFGTDTIKFYYNTTIENNSISFPQTVYVNNSNLNDTKYHAPTGTQSVSQKKLSYISFPDRKNISFLYDRSIKYDAIDSVLNRINIGDSIFRYGYIMDWQCCKFNDTVTNGRAFLAGIRSYTATSIKPRYQFSYDGYLFPSIGSPGENSYANELDHWGYFNGFVNLTGNNIIPSIPFLYTGAFRDPSPTYTTSSTLTSIADPSGGITYYKFEANDLPQYSTSPQSVYINALNNSQNTITLNQVFSNLYTFNLNYDILYPQSVLSGSCNFTCSVTSLDGITVYGTLSSTLYQLASGVRLTFNAPNGSYLLKTTISGCSSSTLTTLGVDINWQNQTIVGNAMTSGGIRLKQQSHFDPIASRTDTIATYTYRNPDGKSSGFLGAVPIYTYPYSQTVINGSTVTTNYTAVCSAPINDLNYTQGSPIGYSHVEVINGTLAHNLGKTTYDFTTLSDARSSLVAPFFPYAPNTQRDWLLGLPKKVVVYDSSGNIIDIRQNIYTDTLVSDTNTNFRSRKLGKVSTTYNGDPTNFSTPYTEYYKASDYFTESGTSFLVKSVDSVYHTNHSLQITTKTYSYDSNYNLIKIVEPYDSTRGLMLEKRFYYPYNYILSSGPIKKFKDSCILNAIISTENWIIGDANPRMINAQITDYQQLPKGHIKPLTIYNLQSNAPVLKTLINDFNPTLLIRNTTYLLPQQSFPVYDSVGNAVEIMSVPSGTSNSVIMSYFNQYPVATVTNAKQTDIAYTSFESDGDGNWIVPSGNRNSLYSLTGKYCYDLISGNIVRSGLNSSTSYIISVWGRTGSIISVNGTTLSGPIAIQNNWSLYSTLLTGVSTVTISGSGLIDELRLHPKYANMETKTYEPMVGVTSTCDANNTVSYYNYDFSNRLRFIKDKDLNVVKELEYDSTTVSVNTAPKWQYQSSWQCEPSLNGNIDTLMKDVSPYSYTYNTTKWVFVRNNCTTCHPACSGQNQKLVGCVCTVGTRQNISSVHTKINGTTWVWRCTYQYCFPDGSASSLYTEDNVNPCTVVGACLN